MRQIILFAVCLALAGCSSNSGGYFDNDGPPSSLGHLKALGSNDIDIKVEAPHKWANRPYTVLGKRYVPVTGDQPMTEVGEASWYGKQFHGKKTSTGEIYDMYALSAAHPTMELPSYARVTNLKNGRSIIVRVNDRGPFLRGRVIDLSYAAAVQLGYQKQGTTQVRVERIRMKDIAAGRIPSTNASDATLVKTSPAPVAAATTVASAAAASSASSSSSRSSSSARSASSSRSSSTAPRSSYQSTYQSAPAQSNTIRTTSTVRSGGITTTTTTTSGTAAAQGTVPSAAPAAAAGAVVASRTGTTAREENIDVMDSVVENTTDPGDPAVSISLTVEETGADESQAMQTYRFTQGGQGEWVDVPSAAAAQQPQSAPAQSQGQAIPRQDAISAIVAEQEAIEAERALAASRQTAAVPSAAAAAAAAAPLSGWTVQLGAFGVYDNAKAAAAHAEMMLSQQQASPGAVRIVDTGSVFRVVVGNVPTQQEAIGLARSVSNALGASAYAIAEPVPKK